MVTNDQPSESQHIDKLRLSIESEAIPPASSRKLKATQATGPNSVVSTETVSPIDKNRIKSPIQVDEFVLEIHGNEF